MTSDVVLSAALRTNLLSLQNTQRGIDATQARLSTGKKVNSALDNPQSFFAAQALTNRAKDLTQLLDGIGQSIQVIKAADQGVTALTSLINQAQSIATSANDALATGTATAKVTGAVTLDGTAKVSSLTGFGASGDKIIFTVTDPAGGTNPLNGNGAATITTATNQTISGLVQAINDLNQTAGAGNTPLSTPAIKATLDSSGKLSLEAVNGGTLHIQFLDAGSTATGVPAQSQATSLGFGAIGKLNQNGATAAVSTFDLTASATSGLASKGLYTAANTLAQASSLINGLKDVTGATTYTTLTVATTTLKLTVGGKTSADLLHIGTNTALTTTIQGVVDGINNDATIKSLVTASFDATTGKISLAAKDASATDIQFQLDNAAGATIQSFNLFGTVGLTTTAAANSKGTEDIRFGAAAGALASYQTQFDSVRSQIDALVTNGDTGYRGTNLLNGNNLVTTFNESRTSTLTTNGAKFDSTSLGFKAANFSSTASVGAALTQASTALASVRSFGSSLANDLSTIQARQDFTNNLISTLNTGAANLTNADQNEEGAKLLALQTRQSLGVTALSLASQSNQSILRLFS